MVLASVAVFSPVLTDAAEKVDVLVYSGNPGGIAAAIVAARAGQEVVVVEPYKWVGGLITNGINTAESRHLLLWTIGGFADEFYRRMGDVYGSGEPEYFFESSVALKVYNAMLAEAGVKVLKGLRLEAVEKADGKIGSVRFTDGTQMEAGVFIDASYEGDLMAMAGVSYAVGRESREEYGEEAAGIRFDKATRKARTVDEKGNLLPGLMGWAKDFKEGDAHRGVMNYNFRLTVTTNEKLRVPFPEPEVYDAGRYALLAEWYTQKAAQNQATRLYDVIDLYGRRNSKFEMNNKQAAIISLGNFGAQFDWPEGSAERREEIYKDHWNYTLGLLKFLAEDESVPENVRKEMRTYGLHKDEFVENGNLPEQLYVREGRRMKGEFVVRQQDVQEDRRKEDSIGISSHFIDSHHVQRLAVSEDEFVNEGRIWRKGYAYQIPYRAIVPRKEECTNLLVPVASSFSHVAFCTLRLESVWMITGHAAGLASVMANKAGVAVQDVDVSELHGRLIKEGQVVNFVEGEKEIAPASGLPEF